MDFILPNHHLHLPPDFITDIDVWYAQLILGAAQLAWEYHDNAPLTGEFDTLPEDLWQVKHTDLKFF